MNATAQQTIVTRGPQTMSLNGQVVTIEQLKDHSWRHSQLVRAAEQSLSINKRKAELTDMQESFASVLLNCYRGYLLDKNPPNDILLGTATRKQVIDYLYDETNGPENTIVAGFFGDELHKLKKELQATGNPAYTDEFFSKKSSYWANVVSKLNTISEFGLYIGQWSKSGLSYEYDTIGKAERAKTDIKKQEQEDRDARAAEKAALKEMSTPEGKIKAISEFIGLQLNGLLSELHDVDKAIDTIKRGPLHKLVGTIVDACGGDQESKKTKLKAVLDKIDNKLDSIVLDEAIDKHAEKLQKKEQLKSDIDTATLKDVLPDNAKKLIDEKAYQKGCNAYASGEHPDSCEYEVGTLQQTEWLRGYKDMMNSAMS